LVVTSGKGGVGKTTSTAALGAALAHDGTKVVVIDFDVGLRNLDLVMGAERRVVFDLINVINGVAKLPQALIRDKRLESLHLLPASQTRDKDALTEDGVAKVIDELREKFDWIICDSPAGIERGATLAMRYADAAIIVTNPEVSSVRDSDRIIGLLDSKTVKAERGERIDGLLISQDHPSERRPIYSPFAKPRPSTSLRSSLRRAASASHSGTRSVACSRTLVSSSVAPTPSCPLSDAYLPRRLIVGAAVDDPTATSAGRSMTCA
jgi:nitrogenase subunit NifH